MAGKAPPAGLPQLSNEAQLEIMELVKKGMSLDEALTRAASMSESEAKMRSRSVRCSKKKKKRKKKSKTYHLTLCICCALLSSRLYVLRVLLCLRCVRPMSFCFVALYHRFSSCYAVFKCHDPGHHLGQAAVSLLALLAAVKHCERSRGLKRCRRCCLLLLLLFFH